MNAPPKPENTGQVLILRADTTPFKDAVVLGQGLPFEKDGQPIKYFWKESLPIGRFLDKDGKSHEVTPQRIDKLIGNFNRAKSKGFLPRVPFGHTDSNNLGYIVAARKNDKGNLELLHQMIGSDAILETSRNKTSICTLQNFMDEHGDTYDELVEHNALVPNPQLSGLSDFTPALVASRGVATPAVVLQHDAPTQEIPMDLTKLREAIGAGTTTDDAKVIEQAIAKLGEGKSAEALALSRKTELDTLTTKLQAAEIGKAASDGKVLELSRTPDASILAEKADLLSQKIDLCLDRGQCTKAQAGILKASLKDGDKPAVLMLSKTGPAGTPIDVVLKVLELNKAFTGTTTGAQVIPDPNKPEETKDLAKKLVDELMGRKYTGPQVAARA